MLEIAKTPSYLSPSSLRVIERQPNTFYCQRMAPDPIPYEPQSAPASVGSAFDTFVKLDWLKKNPEKRTTIRNRVYKDIYSADEKRRMQAFPIEQMLFESAVDEPRREEAEPVGRMLMRTYESNGYATLQIQDVEIHRHFTLLDRINVPLFMKLDAIAIDPFDKEALCPFDWKVRGYGSKSGVSPTKGYYALYAEGINKGAHKLYRTDINAHEVSKDYATQLCTYGWGMGKVPGTPFHGLIDELVMRPNNVRIARYRMLIDTEFQEELIERYVSAWLSLQDGSFINDLSRDRKMVEMLASQENWYD